MSDETVLLTYAELGERLGIAVASAKKAAQRKRWKRVTGNDRLARVHVPLDALPSVTVSGDITEDVPSDKTEDFSASVARLEGQLEGLRGQLEVSYRLTEEAQKRANAAEVREKEAKDELGRQKAVFEVNKRELKADRHQYRQQAEVLRRELEALQEAERLRRRSLWSRLFR